jgi:YHS domain-containing protein
MNHGPHALPGRSCCAGASQAVDPVCGMKVDPAVAKDRLDYRDTAYYFCCDGCLEMFRKDPERYLAKQASAPATAARAIDPVCGRSRLGRRLARPRRKNVLLLQRALPFELQSRPEAASGQDRRSARTRAGRRAVHLPDAPGDRPGRAGGVPEVRHGAGADGWRAG